MKLGLDFLRNNADWGIQQELPDLTLAMRGNDVVVSFFLDHTAYPRFELADRAILRFKNASFYRLGSPTKAEWRNGRCRYEKKAIEWGHFYELIGKDDRLYWPKDWSRTKASCAFHRHFLIYLEAATFECVADSWIIEPVAENALFSRSGEKSKPSPELAASPVERWTERLGSLFGR